MKLPVSPNGFRCIDKGTPLPSVDVNELSRDQAYLYRIISDIRSGVADTDLLHMTRLIPHARWLYLGCTKILWIHDIV